MVQPPGSDLSIGDMTTSLFPWLDIWMVISCSESAGTPPSLPPELGVNSIESLGCITMGIWYDQVSELTLDFTIIWE